MQRDEVALQVDVDDRVPLRLGHVGDHPVAEDARVVDEHVQLAERVDRGLDQALAALPVGAAVGVRHRLAAHRLDLLDHLLRGTRVGPRPVLRTAEVVDHDLGALTREEERVLAPDPATGAGDDRDSPFQCAHCRELPRRS